MMLLTLLLGLLLSLYACTTVYATSASLDALLANVPLDRLFTIQRERLNHSDFLHTVLENTPDTVPSNVKCEKIKRCDRHNVCAIVCKPGSVYMDPWLHKALAIQRQLAYQRRVCHAQLPGSHNSAINMADGYGIEDHVFEGYLQYFSWFKPNMHVHTNDQWFSLTDQLQMGIRFIELDVHWFDNDLRIAHCGGFHSKLLDAMIEGFNRIAQLLGADIQWDSETIGCKPSLSSIPANEQRSLDDALREIATWLHAEANKNEFLMVFFDDESDLCRWKKVTLLLEYIRHHFTEREIVHPSEIHLHKPWPTFQALLKQGKRILFMSGTNYSPRGDELLFVKNHICHWNEPDLPLKPFPVCEFEPSQTGPLHHPDRIFRPETSEIEYGFLNSGGHLGPNLFLLNEQSIPPLMACGVNVPSPDNITPRRMASMVWALDRQFMDQDQSKQCIGLLRASAVEEDDETKLKTTWHRIDCSETKGMVAACMDPTNHLHWKLAEKPTTEATAGDACQQLHGFVYAAPASGYENRQLVEILAHAPPTVRGVWINAKDLVQSVMLDHQEHVEVVAIE